MKNIFLICLILPFLACSQSKPIKTEGMNEFMPLSVGNKWFYGRKYNDGQIYDYELQVVSIDTINRHKYFKIRRTSFDKNIKDTSYTYKREAKDTIFILTEINDNKEFIEAIFSLNKADSFCMDPAYKEINKCRSPVVVSSKSQNKIEFSYHSPEIIDGGYWALYEKGIGITEYRNDWGGSTVLLGYELVCAVGE